MSATDKNVGTGGYVQLFVYRLPKSNSVALQRLVMEIAEKLKSHGTVGSEFYRLHSTEAFQGFTTVANTFAVSSEDELWIELDHYRNRGHRDQVMASLSKDSGAGALFRQLGPLVSQGYKIAMGEFEELDVRGRSGT